MKEWMSKEVNKWMEIKHSPILLCFLGYDPIIPGNPNLSVVTSVFLYYVCVCLPLTGFIFSSTKESIWYKELDQYIFGWKMNRCLNNLEILFYIKKILL